MQIIIFKINLKIESREICFNKYNMPNRIKYNIANMIYTTIILVCHKFG